MCLALIGNGVEWTRGWKFLHPYDMPSTTLLMASQLPNAEALGGYKGNVH